VPDVQLAKVVRETFAETRQRVQRQVQAAIARVTSRGSNDDLMGALAPRPSLPEFLAAGTPTQEPSPWDVSRPTRSLPRITFQGDTTTSTGASANPELAEIVITSAPAKPPLRPALAIAIGVAVVAVAIAVFFALRTQQPPVATNPPVQPPAQAAPIAAPAVDVNRAPASPVPAAIPPKANIKVEKAEPQDTETPSTQKPESEVANRNDTRQPATPAPPQRTTRQQPQRQVQHQRVAPAPAIKIKETPPPPPVTGPRVKVIEDDPKRKNIDVIND
jgi:hypothetical protein